MDLSRLGRSGSGRQGGSDRSLDKVDLGVKWICRGLGEVDLGVRVDLIAAWARWIWASRRTQAQTGKSKVDLLGKLICSLSASDPC